MDESPDAERYHTLIIGCGMAGLAAGIRLALFGRKVLILERHNAPGGLNSFYFKDGRKFDVGLHAVTNYTRPGMKRAPLGRIFRQLRLSPESFQLAPQRGSRIAFPGVDLPFGNGFEELGEAVARAFPGEADRFQELRQAVLAFDHLNPEAPRLNAREVIGRYIREPLLEDMLLCPLMYYGSARERDMDFDQFVTLWRSIFEEGFGRPLEGVRVIIRALLDQYRAHGGRRRMRCGVRRILLEDGRATGVELESGEILRADNVLSTAGWPETRVLCGEAEDEPAVRGRVGRLSFVEAICVLDRQPEELGCPETIVFFNDGEHFHYAAPAGAVDPRSGVVCFPNNYNYGDGESLEDGFLRVTMLASHAVWTGYPEERYREEKERWFPRMLDGAARFLPGLDRGQLERSIVYRDLFTPRTVQHYTGHLGGAVYGSPEKRRTGETGYRNLYLAGTDQGFLGIVGALLSGISMANRHLLDPRS